MNRNDLYSSFLELDEDILMRSEIPGTARRKPGRICWRRPLAALVALMLLALLSVGTAMAASPEFRARIFRIFHMDGEEIIPQSPVGSEGTPGNMVAEPGISIGDILQGEYVHTSVATLAQNGVFLVCTDDDHTRQGSHYDAYYESQGTFIRLEEHSFDREYVLHGTTFRVRLDWAEYQDKTILTWVDGDGNFRIPGNGGNPSEQLIQFIFASTNENGEYVESAYPALIDLRTGELRDVLAGTGGDSLTGIGNVAISKDHTKMLLCSQSEEGYVLSCLDLTAGKMYSLDELSGERVDGCSLLENSLACWSLTDGCYRAWRIDLATHRRTELFDSLPRADANPEGNGGIVFLMGFDSWVHEGNSYTGSTFALEVDEKRNVYVIDLANGERIPVEGYTWAEDIQQIPSPDGGKLLLAERPDGQDYTRVGVLDFTRESFVEFSRENGQREYLAYWFDEDTVIICAELTPESLCSDYCLYRILEGETK